MRAMTASRWLRRILLVTGAATLPLPAAAAPAETPGGEVPFEALFDPALMPRLTGLAWNADGSRFAGLWRDGKRKGIQLFDGATGASLATAFADELTEGPPTPDASVAAAAFGKLSGFAFRPGSDELLLVADDDLFLWKPEGRSVRRLTRGPAEEKGPAFSPDGRRLAFSRDADLWVIDVASGAERRLTEDGRPDEILNGTTDWVYWEEIWGRDATALWWSPDSRSLAFYRFDETGVPTYPLLSEREVAAKVTLQRYPKAGDPNPDVSVRVVEVDSGAIVELATGEAPGDYLARVHWASDPGAVAVERLNRDQTRLDLLHCRADSGKCVELASQQAATWINLSKDYRPLDDGGFLWSQEGSGWRTLHRHDRLGRSRADLLPSGWALEEVVDVLPQRGEVIVVAHRTAALGALGRSVLALDLAGRKAPRLLADGPGWHGAKVAATGAWIHSWSDSHTPTEMRLRSADNAEIALLPGGVELPAALTALPRWEVTTIPAASGVGLPARFIPPAGAVGERHPVITYHYGGPASQVVIDRWEGPRGLWHRWMASRGYLVLSLDNEASRFFGKPGEDRLHRRFGELELAGQLDGVRWLGNRTDVDPQRLGLWGWSGGGSNTLYAILHRPGIWKAAVAGAPVTDWRLYDSIWTERYLDSPQDNPDGYRDSSPISAAESLADALLLVHGTGDDNVHPQNSIALMAKWVAAGKRFEEAIYPDEKHGFLPAASRHFYRRMTDFFDHQLRPER